MDRELIDGLRQDNINAFNDAVRKYKKLVESLSAELLDNVTDREEVVNDTFFKLWRCRYQLDPERGSLQNFVCTLARSCIFDRLRYNNRIKRREVISREENDIGLDVDYENAAARELNHKVIIECISTMPSPNKEVFIDRYYFNMPIKDISEREGLKIKKVENILYRGKKRLKKALIKGGVML